MNVTEALEAELGALPKAAQASTLAAMARRLAAKLDDPEGSVSATASAARELREILDRLTERAAPEAPPDGIADLAARIDKRRAGTSGT